jgi:nucleotide-binding universal stress UspA family protein
MTIKRILVPIDFSAPSRAALLYGVALATPLTASVRVLHVVEVSDNDPVRPDRDAMLRAAMRRVRRALPTIAGVHFGLDVDVRIGDPATCIVDCATENLADAIVMGMRRRPDGPEGTVARVLRWAPCAVVLLPASGAAAGERDRPTRRATADRVRGGEIRVARGRSRSRPPRSA